MMRCLLGGLGTRKIVLSGGRGVGLNIQHSTFNFQLSSRMGGDFVGSLGMEERILRGWRGLNIQHSTFNIQLSSRMGGDFMGDDGEAKYSSLRKLPIK